MNLRWSLPWLVVSTLVLTACGPRAGFFAATSAENKTDAVAVRFVEQDNDVFEFLVLNLTDQPQTVLRDEVILVAGSIQLRREAGGLASAYDLPAHGNHAVKVKYDLARIEGVQSFDISFERAVLTNGEAVAGPVVHFAKR